MIYTTYYDNLINLPNYVIPISISGWAPDNYKGLTYKKLAPKYKFFMEWKENQDNDFYIEHFQKEVLNLLNIEDVLNALYSKLPSDIKEKLKKNNCPWYCNPEIHIALVCYEKPGEFCHRNLVANWLNENGIFCEEYK